MIRPVPNLAAALLVTLSACTDFATLPSDDARPPAPVFNEGDGGAAVLASRTISFPSPLWTPVTLLPESQWLIVDVRGTIGYGRNPACEQLPPAWRWTNFPLEGLVAGPLRGPIYPQVGTGPGSQNRLWPVDGTAETATHARMLVFVTVPGTSLGAYYSGGAGSCGNPTFGGYASGYLISGSHEITVTRIPGPMEIDAPQRVVKNAVTTFHVQPYGDLRWLNPPGAPLPQGRRSWYYFPGDTVGEPTHAFVGPFVSLPHCWDRPVCEYQPQVSGRMLVAGYVEGRAATWKSEIVRVVDAELKLECTAPGGSPMRAPGTVQLERAANISCHAFAEPAAELKNVRWSFTGQDFTFPETAEGDPPIDTPEWGGQMVMSGTISVQAEINGAEQGKQLSVDVQPRAEFKNKEVQVSIRRGTLADVPEEDRPSDPPRNVTELGRARPISSISGYDPGEDLAEVLRTIGMISDEGPNHGLAYLKEVPMQPSAIVVIHPALNRGSVFYRAQAQTSNVVSGTQPCVQSRWATYVRLVEEHEGLEGNANSHVGAFQAALNPAAAEAVEHVVGRTNNLAAMAREWIRLLNPVADNAVRQSSNDVFHSTPGGRVRFGCEFNFDVRGR